MAEGLNQPSRVEEDGPTGCKLLWCGSKEATRGQLRVPQEQASANSVPAAAVIRRMRALSGIIGLKGWVRRRPFKPAVKDRGSTPVRRRD